MDKSPKWYDIKVGTSGQIDGIYIPFPTEDEYIEYFRENERRKKDESGQQEGDQ